MTKKKNAKQRREEREAAKKEKWRNARQQNVESKQSDCNTQPPIADISENTIAPKQKSKKTKVKASGLKSTLIVGKELYTTSFGRGNEANLETHIKKDTISKLNNFPKYELKKENSTLNIEGNNQVNTFFHIQKNTSVKMDKMCLKDKLEQEIFGNNFNDNIHVQIAYCIMDIEKIITLYINQAVYALDNVLRIQNNENTDLLGYLGTRTYEEFLNFDPTIENPNNNDYRIDFESFCNHPSLRYFGDIFVKKFSEEVLTRIQLQNSLEKIHKNLEGNLTDEQRKILEDEEKEKNAQLDNNKKTDKDIYNYKKRVYDIIALIGQLRQWSFHSPNNKWRYWLYNLNNNVLEGEFEELLNKLIGAKINTLNKNFIEYNKVNIIILNDVLSSHTVLKKEYNYDEMIKMYYDFIVKKGHKNMGFSIKKIREYMLNIEDAQIAKDKKYDDSRNKLNKILDFILYYNYIINESYVTDDLIEELRKVTSEEGKEKIYHNEAARLWKNIISEKLSEILTKIEKENIQELQNAIVDNIDIDSVKINPDNMTYFSKLIYLLTYFIDGKEINNLLTKLINKFENIGSFLNTAKQMKLKCKFNKNYSFFENSYQLSEEMRIINSFARMEKPSSNAKKYMYIDACYILGYEAASLDEYDKLFFKDENGNQRKQNDHDFRNFICNNVIENDRFKYLVKYANTKKVRLLAKNEKVIEFVLSQLPEEQLERYCNSCFNEIPLNKIQKLTKLIVQMDQQFERLKKVKQNNDKDNVEKKQCQSIISLYLFVMYLLVKKLVNINSRYVTAFYYVERDSLLYSIDIKYEKDGKNYKDYRKLTNYLRTDESESAKFFRKNGYFKNSKYYKMAEDNYNNSDEKMCTVFRNAIDHLNAVRNANEYIDDIKYIESYYSLYQYLIQRAVIKKYPEISYAKQLEKYKTYSKDFTKALCIPFAYNTPRFKDLTIDALFDKERQINKKAKL